MHSSRALGRNWLKAIHLHGDSKVVCGCLQPGDDLPGNHCGCASIGSCPGPSTEKRQGYASSLGMNRIPTEGGTEKHLRSGHHRVRGAADTAAAQKPGTCHMCGLHLSLGFPWDLICLKGRDDIHMIASFVSSPAICQADMRSPPCHAWQRKGFVDLSLLLRGCDASCMALRCCSYCPSFCRPYFGLLARFISIRITLLLSWWSMVKQSNILRILTTGPIQRE